MHRGWNVFGVFERSRRTRHVKRNDNEERRSDGKVIFSLGA